MEQLKPPGELCLEGNLAENWRKWIQSFELFLIASGISDKSEKVQCATFLHVAGEDARGVFNTFDFAEEGDDNKIAILKEKFKQYCEPRKNLTFLRHQFFTRSQGGSETIDAFVTDLKNKAKNCEFSTLNDSLIRDRIVGGIKSDQLRARLLREADLPVAKAIDICRASEASTSQLKQFTDDNEKLLHALERPKSASQSQFRPPQFIPKQHQSSYAPKKCRNCGGEHSSAQRACPAFGKICHNCRKENHFARVCRSKTAARDKQAYQVEDIEEDMEEFFIGTVQNASDDDWKENITINNKPVEVKLDTGAQCNMMSRTVYDTIAQNDTRLTTSKTRLVSYSGHKIIPVGKASLKCEHKEATYKITFQIINEEAPSLLGRKTCLEMGMIQRIMTIDRSFSVNETGGDILDHYSDLFTGLGCIKSSGKHHIEVDPNIKSVVHPPRKVPVAIRPRVLQELQRMEELGVIEKQPEPTNWVNSMVTVIKPHKLRICIDPRDLNRAIRREHHPLPTVEEVVSRLPNARIFSILDASSGFWQIELDDSSSTLCTFNTPFGRYRFKRLPFGISSAPEVFQKVMTELLEGLEGVECIADDILVWGENISQHNNRLTAVLDRCREKNLKLNRAKCHTQRTQITYVGHLLTADGLKPDPEKVRAIQEMPEPADKQAVMRFMGMVQYLAKFIPNLSEISAPLRSLLESKTQWHWEESQKKSFQQLRSLVASTPVLKYFDVNKPVTLSVDASSKGLGAVIIQDQQPIAYASRALTSTQQRYAQIEKELLAVVYGCNKFHQYIYGQTTKVETDHKPLEPIFKKPLHQTPLRLQRMLLQLQRYSLQVEYKPGKEMYLPDTLSRAYLNEEKEDLLDEELEVSLLELDLPVSPEKLQQFQDATEQDAALQHLKTTVLQGWPEKKSQVPPEIREFWSYRDEITYMHQLLFRNQTLIVPKVLRTEMLKKIHQAHLGIIKCKQRAREILFWPGMGKEIEAMVSQCPTCNENRNSNTKQPLIPHEIPERPWAKVGADLFEFKNANYLLCVDYYSKYPEIVKLPSLKSSATITALKSIFARHGIPDEVVSDNGPQFSSAEFTNFSKVWEFQHTTSSPGYPQSNGQVERTVQTVKNLLKKAEESGRDPYLSLLEYRNSPLESVKKSPAQLLMSRRLKSRLPTTTPLLQPEIQVNVAAGLRAKQKIQKQYYDVGSRVLPPLQKGEKARMQREGKWSPVTIIAQHGTAPQSYLVQTPDGRIYRRNRRHLLKTNESHDMFNDESASIFNEDTPEAGNPSSVEPPKKQNNNPKQNQITRYGREVFKPQRYGSDT